MSTIFKSFNKLEGFYNVPDNDLVMIHRDGRCINRLTGNPISITTAESGYRMIAINVRGKMFNYYHHRLIARTFLERPARHHDKPFECLEVNHIDGTKDNNVVENLEWVTPEENVEHALINGLTQHTPVLYRDIRSNEIVRIAHATICAKFFGIGIKQLRNHLQSKLAGYVTKNWCVFKFDDGSSWPKLREEHRIENSWENQFGAWVACEIKEEGNTVIAQTFPDLCNVLGFTHASAQTFRQRNPVGTPYKGWVIHYDDYSLLKTVETARRFKDRVLFPAKDVTVTNLVTQEITTYPSRNLAADALGMHSDKIRYALKAKNGIIGDLQFVEK